MKKSVNFVLQQPKPLTSWLQDCLRITLACLTAISMYISENVDSWPYSSVLMFSKNPKTPKLRHFRQIWRISGVLRFFLEFYLCKMKKMLFPNSLVLKELLMCQNVWSNGEPCHTLFSLPVVCWECHSYMLSETLDMSRSRRLWNFLFLCFLWLHFEHMCWY